ncbi:MAG: hypothetical protein H6672_19465 [Anaerolineaceae bacterium]|nr:hypothetical protein [Anaerolineaceae bacterium]
METIDADQIITGYVEAYQKLYNRRPKDMRRLENGWVIVNGAQMRLTELTFLTTQLQLEYRRGQDERRSVVNRLLKWFKKQ